MGTTDRVEWTLNHQTSKTIRVSMYIYYLLFWGTGIFFFGGSVGFLFARTVENGSTLFLVLFLTITMAAVAFTVVLRILSRSDVLSTVAQVRFPDPANRSRSILESFAWWKFGFTAWVGSFVVLGFGIGAVWQGLVVLLVPGSVFVLCYWMWWWLPHRGVFQSDENTVLIRDRELLTDGSIRGGTADREIRLETIVEYTTYRIGDLVLVFCWHEHGSVPTLIALPHRVSTAVCRRIDDAIRTTG
ncbi:hypothetical protein RBH26_07560 [Natronolimnohabitans sp. A-GB9]|uniref:hypothetical protein n=1 Tax=Natronolimnohabitans sp. A-GB9 TaxID=3069757 RepID=UPI0027B45512|nr:hypothetical protein [Natronolimnohabitans sp. A-GB9]MDQ2050340.1 hypothetical protein [Natronolimnohabitans sp. A-GB9]